MIRLHHHAYYNEFDPGAAEWLRELIKAGLIAPGVVDERSILDVVADDLRGFTQCHFFAGIGGWSYALRLAGWPDDRPVWTGSPPCQPFSAAGRMEGRTDERHLAPHFIGLVGAARPGMLFGEQVASAAVFGKAASGPRRNPVEPPGWAWLDDLCDRLEAARYAVGANDFSSAGVGAPHIRQRTFFGAVSQEWMADSDSWECDWIADGEGRKPNRTQAGWKQGDGQSAASGEFRGLADSAGVGWVGRRAGQAGAEPGSQQRSDGLRDVGGLGHADGARRPGPTNGFWASADWLHCRDAKWRPVEPSNERMAYGVSIALDACIHEVAIDVEARENIAREALRAMRHGHDPEAIWLQVGGCFGFPAASVLLAILCERAGLVGEVGNGWEAGRSKARVEDFLRAVWLNHGALTGPPQGRGFSEQLARKLGDAMPKMSQKSPYHWRALSVLTGGPLAHSVPGRVQLLRGYGNAINPHAAAEFIQAFDAALAACGRSDAPDATIPEPPRQMSLFG